MREELAALKRALHADPANENLRREYDIALRRWGAVCAICKEHPNTIVAARGLMGDGGSCVELPCDVLEGQVWAGMFLHVVFNASLSYTTRIDRVEGCVVGACRLVFEGREKAEILEWINVGVGEEMLICETGED